MKNSTSRQLRYLLVVTLALGVLACVNSTPEKQQNNTSPSQTVNHEKHIFSKPQQIQKEESVDKVDNTTSNIDRKDEFDAVVAETQYDLYQGNIEKIEKTARQARQNKERLVGGTWKLRAIYKGLTSPMPGNSSEEAWKQHIAKLREWQKRKPESITAVVALGDSLIHFAWNARGSGYSDSVSEFAHQEFERRLAEAEIVLKSARKLSQKCPEYYEVLMSLGIGQGWEKEKFDSVFQLALALEPEYYYFYQTKAYYLLPRWYGKQGEWEQFIDEAAADIGGPEGLILYYRVTSKISYYHSSNYFRQNRISWEKMKQGLQALENKFGLNQENKNLFAKLSLMARDLDFCKAIMKIDNDWSESVWQSKQMLESAKLMQREFCPGLEANKQSTNEKIAKLPETKNNY